MNNLSSTHYAPGSVLATGNIAVNKTDKMSAFLESVLKGMWGVGKEDTWENI